MERGLARKGGKEEQPSWTDSNGKVTDEQDDSHPNHPYLEPNVENAEVPKQRKKKKEKTLLLPTVWKHGLSKNTSIYHRASSLWAYMRTFTPSLSSL